MILKDVEKSLLKRSDRNGFIRPLYEGYSLYNIPNTIPRFLGQKASNQLDKRLYKGIDLKGIKKVVFVLIDGFGYDTWLESSKRPGFFKTFTERGKVSPITTVFPASTAPSLTTMNTGLTPEQHGLPEWYVYFKELDRTLVSLPFVDLEGKKMRADPGILYKGETIYEKLSKVGIRSYVFRNKKIASGTYSNATKKGSTPVSFSSTSNGITKLRKKLESSSGKAYINFYTDKIDTAEHRYGPHSGKAKAAIRTFDRAMVRNLLNTINNKVAEKTILIISADHGQIRINPSNRIFMDDDPYLMGMLKADAKNNTIMPTGLARDIFLHVQRGRVKECHNYLTRKLKNKALVLRTKDAVRQGLFGKGKVSKRFRDRIGDILILPYGHGTMWYRTERKNQQYGVHGGLSKSEMLIPFAIARLSDLID